VAYDNYTRTRIFERTDGDCHICGGRLCYSNYGCFGSRGAWEVEHSVPLSRWGTNHLNNLFAAHISCNRSKRACSTRVARGQYGRTRAPHCKAKKQQIRKNNTLKGGFIGGIIGAVGGPLGSAVGASIGGWIGNSLNPND